MNFKDRCYLFDDILFRGHINVQAGSGSVINWPPGSVIQDYSSADTDPKEIITAGTLVLDSWQRLVRRFYSQN